MDAEEPDQTSLLNQVRKWASLDPDVLTLSGSLMVFSLALQMTERFIPEYLSVLGAGSVVVGFYGTFKELLNASYPYPGGILSDRFGSRGVLVSFGLITSLGFILWSLVPTLGPIPLGPVVVPGWIWIFLGTVFVLAWKELGLGATFALVKDAVRSDRLARGFASTEVLRRIGYLVGPITASAVLAAYSDFLSGYQVLLFLAITVCLLATYGQYRGYRAAEEYADLNPESQAVTSASLLQGIVNDFLELPDELQVLLAADSLIRFGNGMVYVFFVLVITRYHEVGWSIFGFRLDPPSFFGLLLGVEMTIALISMIPASRLADELGLKPVVAVGFFVYGIFPLLLILAPADPVIMILLFAFSGLRFAGMPGHKAMIVGPAESGKGGRTTGVYYLIRNILRVPAPAIGGILFEISPKLSFTLASLIGLLGTMVFLVVGKTFDPKR
ncbi:MAG: MFS transporter [bacterium]